MSIKSKKEVDQILRKVFHVKGRQNIPPFTGWKKPNGREDLYDAMNLAGCFTKGAEVGVSVGRNASQMLARIDNLHLICIDPWSPYHRWKQHKMDRAYARAMKRLAKFGDRVTVIRKESMEALEDVADGSLDFVYIDGFHDFDWVMPDLIFWAKKVRSCGIIAGHDYYAFYRGGVMTAVNAYVKAHNVTEWYVTEGPEPSWFWVKK